MPLRRAAVVMAALALSAATLSAQDSAQGTLTLADAVNLALRNNGRIHDALDGIEETKIARRAAQSAFRPKFVPHVLGALGNADGISNQSYGLDISQRFPAGTELHATVGAVSSRNQLGSFYYSDTTISLAQPLYKGGAGDTLRRSVESSERRIETAVEAHKIAEQQVAIEVAAAFYAIVAQQQVIEVAAKALERTRHLLAVSEAKLDIGKVSQLDVLRAHQLVREAESQLLDARAVADDAADQLRLLTGQVTRQPVVITAPIPSHVERVPLDDAVALARDRRVDVLRARRTLGEAEHTVRAARQPLLPRIDFRLALTRRETSPSLRSSFGLDRFRLVPFFGISMPLDHPALGSGSQTSTIELGRRQRELAATQMRAEIDVRRAFRAQERLAHSLRGADDSIAFAEKQADVARVRFDRGLSDNLDLVTAEADLLAAHSRRSSIAAALAVARLTLKAAIGTLDLAEDFRQTP